ncbi:acyltransferase [Marinomonas fungiae]|uniref:Bacterial transferase hexapeptide (Six repeats) n=1 Tax=Marinomonas fungiae TaxID=1137284 RepID=A0A0K6II01_9GAMM|nr:acyltransferase [Marinomonas fungiae]CUB02972.1 Bacterial transferase hexapeptide (six repeats) [Marinomonas fungiae]
MSLVKKLKLKLFNTFRVQPNNLVDIHPQSKIKGCRISIKGTNNRLEIAQGCNLRGVLIELNGEGCQIKIERGTIIGEDCYLSSREKGTQLTIGADCMFSRNVKIMTSDGHDILRGQQRINPAQSIHIGNHVWLADNVTILKGVRIGDGSVVGINSTLTKSIAEQQIAVGSPAKVVASEVTWRDELTF